LAATVEKAGNAAKKLPAPSRRALRIYGSIMFASFVAALLTGYLNMGIYVWGPLASVTVFCWIRGYREMQKLRDAGQL